MVKNVTPPKFAELPLNKIDPPSNPMRETFDMEKLEELTESVILIGVVLPIVVKGPFRGRYEITDGHRRYLASERAGKQTIPCVILPAGAGSAEASKVHANLFREDVNAAEAAVFYSHLLEKECGGDVDRLCEFVRQKRAYVESRLVLLRGDGEVMKALKERRVTFAVAQELNKVQNTGDRRSFLEAAIAGGATARLVMNWRLQAESLRTVIAPPGGDGSNPITGLPAPIPSMACFICDGADEPWTLELLYVHRRCLKIFIERFLQRVHGIVNDAQRGADADKPSSV